MAETSYTFNIGSDFPNSVVNEDLLIVQIKEDAQLAAKLIRVDTEGQSNECYVVFNDSLTSEEESNLNTLVSAHTGEAVFFPNVEDVAIGSFYEEEEYNAKGMLLRRSRFADIDSNGDLIYKIDEELFTYQGNILKSHVYKRYDFFGDEVEVVPTIYESTKIGGNTIIRRKREV